MHSHGSMTLRTVLFLFAVLLTPLLSNTPSAAPPAAAEPHDFVRLKRSCNWCHVSVGIKTRGVMRKTVGQICAECHELNNTQHPVEMKPAMAIPADLPLDIKGLMTCTTCHNIHRSRMNSATGLKTMYLRRDGPPRAFCEACHINGIQRADEAAGRR